MWVWEWVGVVTALTFFLWFFFFSRASKIPSVWFKVAKSDAAPLIAAVTFAAAMGVGALVRTTLKHEDINVFERSRPYKFLRAPNPRGKTVQSDTFA